jgi:hypothetical protein
VAVRRTEDLLPIDCIWTSDPFDRLITAQASLDHSPLLTKERPSTDIIRMLSGKQVLTHMPSKAQAKRSMGIMLSKKQDVRALYSYKNHLFVQYFFLFVQISA